jgi:TatD DNase family protein
MNIVDTHCHLHFDAFDADREAVISRARVAGVQHMILVGTDPENNRKAKELASKH